MTPTPPVRVGKGYLIMNIYTKMEALFNVRLGEPSSFLYLLCGSNRKCTAGRSKFKNCVFTVESTCFQPEETSHLVPHQPVEISQHNEPPLAVNFGLLMVIAVRRQAG